MLQEKNHPKNEIVNCISGDGFISVFAVDSTDMVGEAEQIHKTSAVVTAALGRLLTAACLMGNNLKGDNDSVTLRVKGDGPVGSLLAVSDSGGNVRGYAANPIVELPLNPHGKLDVGGAVGKNGSLTVIRDIGLKEPYSGQVSLISGEIAEDITGYFAVSEQIPTVCGLGVLINPDLTVAKAGGFLVHALPGADSKALEAIEANVAEIRSVTDLLSTGVTPEELCFQILKGLSPSVLQKSYAEYRCSCNRRRVEKALISLGRQEIEEMAKGKDDIHVECHFCNKEYSFTPEALLTLIK